MLVKGVIGWRSPDDVFDDTAEGCLLSALIRNVHADVYQRSSRRRSRGSAQLGNRSTPSNEATTTQRTSAKTPSRTPTMSPSDKRRQRNLLMTVGKETRW